MLSILAPQACAGERPPKANYLLRCSGCHGTDGTGSSIGGIPPFPGYVAPLVSDPDGRTYVMHVPGVVASGLSDGEVAAVLNYVLDHWGDASAERFTAAEVAERRRRPVDDLIVFRRALVAKLKARGVALGAYPWP